MTDIIACVCYVNDNLRVYVIFNLCSLKTSSILLYKISEMSNNYRLVLRGVIPEKKITILRFIRDNFFPSQEVSEVQNLLNFLPQVITVATSLSEAKRIKSEIEAAGGIVMFYHPDAILNLKPSKDVIQQTTITNSTIANNYIKTTNITYGNLFYSDPNFINPATKDFIYRYAKAYKIDVPVAQAFDQKLANSKTKKEVENKKERNIIIGIIRIIFAFFISFDSAEDEKYNIISPALFLSGSIITLTQITSKEKYGDARKVEKARTIKQLNHKNTTDFYDSCLVQARHDYQQHIYFLSGNPSSKEIELYIKRILLNRKNGIVQLELYSVACLKYLSRRPVSSTSSNVGADIGISLGIGVEFDVGQLFF